MPDRSTSVSFITKVKIFSLVLLSFSLICFFINFQWNVEVVDASTFLERHNEVGDGRSVSCFGLCLAVRQCSRVYLEYILAGWTCHACWTGIKFDCTQYLWNLTGITR